MSYLEPEFIPIEKVEVRRYGTHQLMILLPDSFTQPRGVKVGDWLQGLLERNPNSKRLVFEPTSPPDPNGIRL